MPVETKPFWQSKTILVNLLMALAVIVGQFFPPIGEFIRVNFDVAAPVWAVVNMLLRLISKKDITIN